MRTGPKIPTIRLSLGFGIFVSTQVENTCRLFQKETSAHYLQELLRVTKPIRSGYVPEP